MTDPVNAGTDTILAYRILEDSILATDHHGLQILQGRLPLFTASSLLVNTIRFPGFMVFTLLHVE